MRELVFCPDFSCSLTGTCAVGWWETPTLTSQFHTLEGCSVVGFLYSLKLLLLSYPACLALQCAFGREVLTSPKSVPGVYSCLYLLCLSDTTTDTDWLWDALRAGVWYSKHPKWMPTTLNVKVAEKKQGLRPRNTGFLHEHLEQASYRLPTATLLFWIRPDKQQSHWIVVARGSQ